jgi:hypothetical protein
LTLPERAEEKPLSETYGSAEEVPDFSTTSTGFAAEDELAFSVTFSD